MNSLARALIVASITVVVPCALLSRSHEPRACQVLEAPIDDDSSAVPDGDREEQRGAVDLYGNDVSDAVAKYSLDATGVLYEVHSPQTEIPRLASPKS